MLRLLVAEGNTSAGRRRIAESAGATPAESYADVLRAIAPDANVDIERLSYRRNLVAGALASARSLTIGVIIPSIINSFFAATIEALEERMAGSGYQLMLGNTGYSAEPLVSASRVLRQT